ncbi:hypothetical protein [Mycobacterium vicinigordonae]|uniref:ESX-1 secretion-associated protein EspA/EspE-like domain-containing protein n=1 Tax=Mycobacterium vicinigordonae TaxID=1719132 RepID=A0A7D6HSF3_9MYCO|nr:hypothetical protein [Mycobacterium vicinigordonae]QLL05453.1 hypothetical protein H0P51_16455 [Mycobacterium vicinigordonae]
MHLRYLRVLGLVAKAGGNPWSVNKTLQRGRPAQISALAQAFHDAGHSTGEAEASFAEARRRFEAAWNRETGDHPINDAAEVQRATKTLGVQATQLPQIAADLESVAAVLAEAQRASAKRIAVLEAQLEGTDHRIGELRHLLDEGRLSATSERGTVDAIHNLERQATSDTAEALHDVDNVREIYSKVLQRLMTKLRVEDGYDAAVVDTVDGRDSLTREQAERDVHAALAGDQDAAKRVNAVLNSITAEQLSGQVPLTPEQASVLSQLQAQQHGMAVYQLYNAAQLLGDQKGMLANSWQLMSNPAILFPKTDLEPGSVPGDEMVRGDAAQLPEEIQSTLASPLADFALHPATIAEIMRSGNPALQKNTELDRAMLRKASAMMNSPSWTKDPASKGDSNTRDIFFTPLVASVLTAVSPDHQAVHEALIGSGGDEMLDRITHHLWPDNGKGAATLFNWIEGAARGPEVQLAAETARAYGQYIGTHDLLHLPGHHTLGSVNPDLVRAMARGLAPYVNNIAGVEGGLTEFGRPLDKLDSGETGTMRIAKGIFAVLSTDTEASKIFSGRAQSQALLFENAYAQDLLSHAPHLDSYNANLGSAMTLRGLVDLGIHNAVEADVENQQLAADAARRAEYDQRKAVYDTSLKIVSTGVGFIPEGGALGSAVISVLGGAIENDVLGPAPLASTLHEHTMPLMSTGRVDREILDALIASGQHVPLPEGYLTTGQIGDPDLVATFVPNLTADQYDHTLNQALRDFYAQNFGVGRDRPIIPDQDMMNRYNLIVANSNPTQQPDPKPEK